MPSNPQITVALVRELLNSPAQNPVLYIEDETDIAVGPEALVDTRRAVVATREEVSDYFGEHHADGLDDDTIRELLPATDEWVESTLETLRD
ncbi:hypothetical protein [Streptomyces sp. NPDC058603]|uniref:hypothetical protein n=1 Tax=Streptomyces sp. NPDC058603 TaxID=3346551 RepID=UPI00365C6E3D